MNNSMSTKRSYNGTRWCEGSANATGLQDEFGEDDLYVLFLSGFPFGGLVSFWRPPFVFTFLSDFDERQAFLQWFSFRKQRILSRT